MAKSSRSPSVRQSRPDYSNGLYAGRKVTGLGPIPRRGWDERTSRLLMAAEARGGASLKHFYQTAPLRLLKVLLSIHPMAKMAHSNNAAAACSPGDTQIVVEGDVTDPESGETSRETDALETAKIEAFLNQYPGGLCGLQRALLRQLEWSGQFVIEAIPAQRLKGVKQVVTIDPLTTFYEAGDDGTLGLFQYGWAGQGSPSSVSGSLAASLGTRLDENRIAPGDGTVLSGAMDYDDDNPNGDPIFGGALAELIKDLGQEQNLSDILRGWAYPHVSIGFPVEAVMQRAKDHPELLIGRGMDDDGNVCDLTPEEYADDEFDKFMAFLAGINPDDPLVMPVGATAAILDGGTGLSALDGLLKMRRHRVVMGLDQMPNSLGITDGGTQAYAEEQGQQQAKKLEYVRGLINAAIVWLCNLHLRLQGKKLIARAVCQPIRPGDGLMDARTRAIDVATDLDLVDEGMADPEDVAVKHTGSGTVGPPKPKEARTERRSKKNAKSSAGKSGDGKNGEGGDDSEADDSQKDE